MSAQSTSPFNTLETTITTFSPSPSTLPGLPLTTFSLLPPLTLPSVGYQSGDLVNGKVLYYPWQVLNGSLISGIPQGVMVSYNAAPTGYGTVSNGNWSYFDLTTLIHVLPYQAAGYNGAIVVGSTVYLTPAPINPYPVFVEYDATKSLTDPGAYQVFPAPPLGGVLGQPYGWCGGVYDGKYIYYTPSVSNGNIVRHDSTTPFNPNTPGSNWASFNMATKVNAAATSFQSAAYDGHRFIYFIPNANRLLVRFDTQFGTPGTPNPAAFTNPAAYKTLDPTQLGISGPPVTGQGNVQNLQGFTGAEVVWDAAHANEYLYFVPWATYSSGNNLGAATLESTAARVRIGTQAGSIWSYVDVTGTDTPPTAAPNWEMFDLQNLITNPQWASNVATLGWPAYPAQYPTGSPWAGQSMIAGFQLAWIDTGAGSPRVGFGADVAQFWVEHDVGHSLSDPTGWYVGQVPTAHASGTMGGAWDAVHQIFYPSSPAVPLIQSAFATPKASTATAIYRIDSGSSSSHTDFFNHVWSADEFVQGGSLITTGNQINNTMTPMLYQSALNGVPAYTLPVANGTYNVILKFAEIQYSIPGQRQFNVLINNSQVLTNFDIVQAAGAGLTAIDQSFMTTVTGGSISIQFRQGAIAYPLINAIEVDAVTSPQLIEYVNANPATVTATSSVLSVTAYDPSGSPLKYLWNAPSGVTLSNSTAASPTATFSQAGTFTIGVTVSTSTGQTACGSVVVTVSQNVTSIAVSPSATNMRANGTRSFHAYATDQFGHAITVTPVWSTSGGGTITSGGVLTATNTPGTYNVTAAAGGATGKASVTVK